MVEMTEREKFWFDLQGFLVVPNFLSKDELESLNQSVDACEDLKGKDGNSNTAGSEALAGTHKRGMFSGMVSWPKPHCIPFRELIVHPKAIPYLNTMHGRGWRLDHAPFILTSDYGTEGLVIHGSTNRHFDGSQYYTYRNGQIRCGMVVLQYQLTDVEEGDVVFFPSYLPHMQEPNFTGVSRTIVSFNIMGKEMVPHKVHPRTI